MTTLAEATAVRWWEGNGAQQRYDSLVAAIESDAWGVHDLCTLTACRTPLHPGPCKGWKHTLHLVAPGAFKALEKDRVDKLNRRRLAKVAALKANGQKVPPALLKEIQPRAHPGTPPPGWKQGDLAPGQPAALADKLAAAPAANVAAKLAKGPAHIALKQAVQHATPAAAVSAPTPPPVTAPQRATWKGHGSPAEGVYFGTTVSRPDPTGTPVKITVTNGGTRLEARNAATGTLVHAGGTAGKFWLAPSPAQKSTMPSAPPPGAPQPPSPTPTLNQAQRTAANLAGYRSDPSLDQINALNRLTEAEYKGLPQDVKGKLHGRLRMATGSPASARAVADKWDRWEPPGSSAPPAPTPLASTAPHTPVSAQQPDAAFFRSDPVHGAPFSPADRPPVGGKVAVHVAPGQYVAGWVHPTPAGHSSVDLVRVETGMGVGYHKVTNVHAITDAPAAPPTPAPPPAPAAPRIGLDPNAPARVKDAHAVATRVNVAGAYTSKKQVEAYGKLTKADYDSLPIASQRTITTDLKKAEAKFLDPKKKAEATALLARFGDATPTTPGKVVHAQATKTSGTLGDAAATAKIAHNPGRLAPDRRVNAYSVLTKDQFDALPAPDRAAILRDLDAVANSKPAPALEQRARDVHAQLRGAPTVAPAAPATPHARALEAATNGTDNEAVAAARALTRADLAKLTPDERALIAKRIGTTATVGNDNWALVNAIGLKATHEHDDHTLGEVADARAIHDKASGTGGAHEYLNEIGKLTGRDFDALETSDRTDILRRLSNYAFRSPLPEDERRAHNMETGLRGHTNGAKLKGNTLQEHHDAVVQGHLKRVRDNLSRTLANFRAGQTPVSRTLSELTDLERTIGQLAPSDRDALRKEAYDLAKGDPNLKPIVRAKLANMYLPHGGGAPAAVWTAVAEVGSEHGISTTPIGTILTPTKDQLAKVDPWISDLLAQGAAAKLAGIADWGTPPQRAEAVIDLAHHWQSKDLGSRLSDAAKKDAAKLASDVHNNTTNARQAVAAGDLAGYLAGKAPADHPLNVRAAIGAVQNDVRGNSGVADLAGLSKADFDALSPEYKSAISLHLLQLHRDQAQNKTPLQSGIPKAGELMARWSGNLPNYPEGHVNRAVISARFDSGVLPPEDLLKAFELLDPAEFDRLTPADRKEINDRLVSLADVNTPLGASLPLGGRHDAQYLLDVLNGHLFGGKNARYVREQELLFSIADPGLTVTDAKVVDKAQAVSKAGYDALPQAYRDAIDARLLAAHDPVWGPAARAELVRLNPAAVPKPSPAFQANGARGATRTSSTDPKVNAVLDTVYGTDPKAHTVAHQLKTYGGITQAQFSTLNTPEQQQVLGDLQYIASSSKGPNAKRAADYISRFTPAGTPAGSVGTGVAIPPPGAVGGQTVLPTPASGLLAEKVGDRGADGGRFIQAGGKRVWGEYGAAGILLANDGPDGKRRYLMVQRGAGISDPGKWHYPGGAIDAKETAYQGGSREVLEELGFDPADLAAAKVHGFHESSIPGSTWKYTSIVATVDKPLTPKLKNASHGGETADAKWLTIDEIRKLDRDGKLLAPLQGGAFENNVVSILPPKAGPTLGQAATKKLPRLQAAQADRRKTVGKTLRGRDMFATDKSGRAARVQGNKDAPNYDGKTADGKLAALAHMQGFDDLPTVLPKSEIDKLAASGDYWVVYRGVKTPYSGNGVTAKSINDDLRYGAAYFGHGIYGNGYYFTTVERVARHSYADGSRGSMVRALIPKDIKTAEGKDKVNEADRDWGGKYGGRIFGDAGRLAIAQGLDALKITTASHLSANNSTPSFNLLNRAILIVQEEPHV